MKAREEEGMGEYDQGVLKEEGGGGVERREKKLEKLRAPNFCN